MSQDMSNNVPNNMSKKFIASSAIIILIALTASVSFAYELNPTQEKIEAAVKAGMMSRDLFGSDRIKGARFGEWPGGNGGLVESKLVYLTIVSAMRMGARMPDLSSEEIGAIVNSTEMPIRISSTERVFNVVLKQGGRTIQPSRMEQAMQMPPAGGSGAHPQSVKAYFRYSELDPQAKTRIVFIEDFGEIEFDIDFSAFD